MAQRDPRSELPLEPGVYVVAYQVKRRLRLEIGALGELEAVPGFLLYVGSAHGMSGIRMRLGRHLYAPGRKTRWHVDYVGAAFRSVAAWWKHAEAGAEHHWATLLQELPRAQVPLARFGASDCRCETHLVWVPELPDLTETLYADGAWRR